MIASSGIFLHPNEDQQEKREKQFLGNHGNEIRMKGNSRTAAVH